MDGRHKRKGAKKRPKMMIYGVSPLSQNGNHWIGSVAADERSRASLLAGHQQ